MGVALALGVSAQIASGQMPPQNSDDALRAMEQMAGVIFAGRVVAVRRQVGNDGADGVVETEFAVDDAVQGVSGGSYTLREWAGLWPAGDEPFRVGQRFLMLIHTPSTAGLSSPVGGMDGAIPIRNGDAAPAPGGAPLTRVAQAPGAANPGGADGLVVDMRWVQTWVVCPLAYRAESVARPTGMPTGARANLAQAGAANLAEAQVVPGSAGLSGDSAAPSVDQPTELYATVLSKLRGWVRSDHAAR